MFSTCTRLSFAVICAKVCNANGSSIDTGFALYYKVNPHVSTPTQPYRWQDLQASRQEVWGQELSNVPSGRFVMSGEEMKDDQE